MAFRKTALNKPSRQRGGEVQIPQPDLRTREDRLWESKFYIFLQPQKRAWNKSNNLMTSSCASCSFLRSRLESQSWNFFSSFPNVKNAPTPPDSGKTPQLRTSKLAQTGGKTDILHLEPSCGIYRSHEIETLPNCE